MDPAADDRARILALDYWRSTPEVEPLGGGITNRNYLVREGQRRLVVRLCADLPHLGVDRRNELACQRAACALGIGPEVVHHEPGVLISEHLPGRTLAADDLRRPEVLGRVARTLRRLHDGWDGLTGEMLYFSPFQVISTYAATARRLGARLPEGTADLLDDARRLAHRVPAFRPALCHNDLLAANILDDGHAVRLVDWEYAGIGHPLFDLANLAGNGDVSDEDEATLLIAYRGAFDPAELGGLRLFRAASLLREALWSVIQTVTSPLDFDYDAYARENLTRHRRARERIDAG